MSRAPRRVHVALDPFVALTAYARRFHTPATWMAAEQWQLDLCASVAARKYRCDAIRVDDLVRHRVLAELRGVA